MSRAEKRRRMQENILGFEIIDGGYQAFMDGVFSVMGAFPQYKYEDVFELPATRFLEMQDYMKRKNQPIVDLMNKTKR